MVPEPELARATMAGRWTVPRRHTRNTLNSHRRRPHGRTFPACFATDKRADGADVKRGLQKALMTSKKESKRARAGDGARGEPSHDLAISSSDRRRELLDAAERRASVCPHCAQALAVYRARGGLPAVKKS